MDRLSTLRYADRAKQIKVVVEVQENPTDKLIRQLKEENDKLKTRLSQLELEARSSSSLVQSPADGPPELPGGPRKTEIRPPPLLPDEIDGPPELPGGPRKTEVRPPPVLPGEDPRAGRWWWEQSSKECGLHKG